MINKKKPHQLKTLSFARQINKAGCVSARAIAMNHLEHAKKVLQQHGAALQNSTNGNRICVRFRV